MVVITSQEFQNILIPRQSRQDDLQYVICNINIGQDGKFVFIKGSAGKKKKYLQE